MEQLWLLMIKFIIAWYSINLVVFGVLLILKVIERHKEKQEEQQKDYRQY